MPTKFNVLALALLLSTLPLTAQSHAPTTIHFDPPNPTSRTPVVARIHLQSSQCTIAGAAVTRSGQFIDIDLRPSEVCPAIAGGADTAVDLGLVPPGVYHV